MADEICERIACGESLVSITRRKSPSYRTVMRWLRTHEEFRQNYACARDESANANAETVDFIVEQVLKGKLDANAARVAMDGLKWSAGKKMPKKYGEKVTLGGDPDNPINHKIDGSELLEKILKGATAGKRETNEIPTQEQEVRDISR